MNWKKGFQRVAVLVSVVTLVIGLIRTWDMAERDRNQYRTYQNIASNTPSKDAYKTIEISGHGEISFPDSMSDESIAVAIRENILGEKPYSINLGLTLSLLSAALPWLMFGAGLYLVQGFRRPN